MTHVLVIDCNPEFLFSQVGTYSNGSHCIPCDLGHYCPSPANAPQPCPAGTYSNETGAVTCKACDAGHSCLNPSNTPVACPAGQYSISGQSSCAVCIPNVMYRMLHGGVKICFFYLQVVKITFYEGLQKVSENKIHILKPLCNFLFIKYVFI